MNYIHKAPFAQTLFQISERIKHMDERQLAEVKKLADRSIAEAGGAQAMLSAIIEAAQSGTEPSTVLMQAKQELQEQGVELREVADAVRARDEFLGNIKRGSHEAD